jgi:hypothetical protein
MSALSFRLALFDARQIDCGGTRNAAILLVLGNTWPLAMLW